MRCFIALCAVVALLCPGLALAERIAVREGVLRQSPSPFGAIKKKIPYDTEVTVEKRQEGWVRISAPESGWLHGSALSTSQQSLKMAPGKASRAGAVAEKEVALAGKGFDKNVEAAYRKEHGQLRYDLMDRVERITVPEAEVKKFAEANGTGRAR
ncbi:MAG TPA: SH3 domain-containing protein [Desulfurivibrionaceae bacterium]|nr:SH3 domain-containing protein [Desulfurivibrionaceae bacterium]